MGGRPSCASLSREIGWEVGLWEAWASEEGRGRWAGCGVGEEDGRLVQVRTPPPSLALLTSRLPGVSVAFRN